MYKEKSLLDTLKQINNRLDEHKISSKNLLSPRSVESKPFYRDLFSAQKSDRVKQLYAQKTIHLERPHSNYNFANYQPQYRNITAKNIWTQDAQIYKPFSYQRKNSSESMNLSKYSNDLIRSQSVNQMYKTQRIDMLRKINSILQNQNQKSSIDLKQNEKNHIFQTHMSSKIDRLQRYLLKIKRQRQKQHIPTIKIVKQQKRTLPNQEKNIQNNGDFHYIKIFSELDQIKKQLTGLRTQALQVKNKNSVQKNPYNVEKQHYLTFQNSSKIINPQNVQKNQIIVRNPQLVQSLSNHSNLQYQIKNYLYTHQPKTVRPKQRTIIYDQKNQRSNNFFQKSQTPKIDQKQHPKITFSFVKH